MKVEEGILNVFYSYFSANSITAQATIFNFEHCFDLNLPVTIQFSCIEVFGGKTLESVTDSSVDDKNAQSQFTG